VATIGLVVHHQRPEAAELAQRTVHWLLSCGHRALLLEEPPFPDLDLAVSLGGDGTMLRTVDMVASAKVPVLGVNLGNLGYLTTVEPDQLHDALDRFVSGEYRLDARMTLDVRIFDRHGQVTLHCGALNDVVLQRPAGQHTVRARLAVNGAPFLSFAADSLIVATPTGSTAYNLSARGPIVSPRARVQIVTPVAAHMLFDRSLVLAADEEVTLSPEDGAPADLVVDGSLIGVLEPGHTLRCAEGASDALLVTFGDRHFHDILKSKFNLSDR